MKPQPTEFRCNQCNYVSLSSDSLRQHIKRYRAYYPCPKCPKQLFTENGIAQHMQNMHRVQILPQYNCNISVGTISNKKTIKKSHISQELYACQVCRKNYKSRKSFRNHKCPGPEKRVEVSQKPNELITRKKRDPKFYKCYECPGTFKDIAQLQRHLRSAEHGNLITCEFCKITFLGSSTFLQHINDKLEPYLSGNFPFFLLRLELPASLVQLVRTLPIMRLVMSSSPD